MNRILSLEEVTQFGRGQIWVQEAGIKFCVPVIYDLEHSPFLRFKICTAVKCDRHLKYRGREYGKTWRCFDRKPAEIDMMKPFEKGA